MRLSLCPAYIYKSLKFIKESLYAKVMKEKEMYDSRDIANRLLELAKRADQTLTPMQVLKLVYIAHGWTLGLLHRALIKDEVQAWQYGPVIPRLYNAVRRYKAAPVTEKLNADGEELDEDAVSIVDQVFDEYGKYSGIVLSRITHAPNSPWGLTYTPGSFGEVIPIDLIEDHYARLARDAAE